jgi:ComF family protein
MLIRSLIELITPEECLGCGHDGVVFCTTCIEKSGLGKGQACFRCNRSSPTGRTCEGCRKFTQLAGVVVASYYAGPVKELVLKLKFHRLRAVADVAANMVLSALPDAIDADIVTAVPVSAGRYRERGYNQSELLARQVAARLGLPYSSTLARTSSAHQLGVDRRTRLEQIKGAFYPLRALERQRVLVVDDVVTTGATLSEAAAVLTAAGASSVWGAAVARH